jgi:hypothetical protein
MTYSITHTGNITITLADNTVDNSTSLALVGRGTTNYGSYLWPDLVKLLENCYGSSEPSNPITGQLWYRSDNRVLYINKPYTLTDTDMLASSTSGNKWVPLVDLAYLKANYSVDALGNAALIKLKAAMQSGDPDLIASLETLQLGKYLKKTGDTATGPLKLKQLTFNSALTGYDATLDPGATGNAYLAAGWKDISDYVIGYVAGQLLSINNAILALQSAIGSGTGGTGGTTGSTGSAISGFENLGYGVGFDPSANTASYVRSVASAVTTAASTQQYVSTNIVLPPIAVADVDSAHDNFAVTKGYVDSKLRSTSLPQGSTQSFDSKSYSLNSIVLPTFSASVLPGGANNSLSAYSNYAVTKAYVDAGLSAENLSNILSKSTTFKATFGTSGSGVSIPAIPLSNYSGKVLAVNSTGTGLEWINSPSPITNTVGTSTANYIKNGNNMLNVFGSIAAASFRKSSFIFSNNVQPWEATINIPNGYQLDVPYDIHATFTPNPAVQTATGFVGTMNCYISAMTATSVTVSILCNPATLSHDKVAYTINGLVTN